MKKDQLTRRLALLGHKGGKARLTKLSAQQRQEIARHAADVRWQVNRAKFRGMSLKAAHKSAIKTNVQAPVPVYPLLVKNPPLRVRLVRQAIEHNGFKVAQRAWVLGEFAHVECSPLSRNAAIDDPCELISKGLRRVGVIVRANDIRVEHFGKVFVVPVRISGIFPVQEFVHSDDYHVLEWQGHLYRLPDRAARMIKFLHEAYIRNDPWCSAEAVRLHMGMKSSQRIDHLFRRQDGPRVLRDLIWSDRSKRSYRIKLSENFGPFHSGT